VWTRRSLRLLEVSKKGSRQLTIQLNEILPSCLPTFGFSDSLPCGSLARLDKAVASLLPKPHLKLVFDPDEYWDEALRHFATCPSLVARWTRSKRALKVPSIIEKPVSLFHFGGPIRRSVSVEFGVMDVQERG
jgi:hypothetical protein